MKNDDGRRTELTVSRKPVKNVRLYPASFNPSKFAAFSACVDPNVDSDPDPNELASRYQSDGCNA